MKQIIYKGTTLKVLGRLPPKQARRIRSKIETYAADPMAPTNNVLKLTGRDEYRLRVGDWRVLFIETEDAIKVMVIRPRGDVYR